MRFRIAAIVAGLSAVPAHAQLTVPALSSRPGAAYTLYLNFGGFSYSGTWFGRTPGTTPAYDTNGNAASLNSTELANVRELWSRTAEKYSAINVNVTTVDPAVAAGQAGTDAQRQAYYDATPRMMHMVIGGNGSWYDSSGVVGVSGLSAAATTQSGGLHTNWTFSSNYVFGGTPFLRGIGETIAHENGHALRLEHQSLWSGSTLVREYDPGTSSRAPIMGDSDNATRGLWRRGTSIQGPTVIQNDPAVLLQNAGIAGNGTAGFMDSGIGHTQATATALPLIGTTINPALARGHIAPNTSADPNPLGEANYTADYFTFTLTAVGSVNVTLRSGLSTVSLGTADPGAMLDATLRLRDFGGTVIATSALTDSLTETITQSNLAAGTYYLQISSAGADPQYFDMGSYFLTGTVTPVPEPGYGLVWRLSDWGSSAVTAAGHPDQVVAGGSPR